MLISAYGLSVSCIDEANDVPLEVRNAWREYVMSIIRNYEIISTSDGLKRVRRVHD